MSLTTYLIFRLIVGDREAVGHLDRVLVNSTWEVQVLQMRHYYLASRLRIVS